METVIIEKIEMPIVDAYECIDIFNKRLTASSDETLYKWSDFIKHNGVLGIINTEKLDDMHVLCTFVLDKNSPWCRYNYAVISGEVAISNFFRYGLIYNFSQPVLYTHENGRCHIDYPGSCKVISHIDERLYKWWLRQPETFRFIFSVYPSTHTFWSKVDLETKLNIYNYSILRKYYGVISDQFRRSIMNELVFKLALYALDSLGIDMLEVEEECFEKQQEYEWLHYKIEKDIIQVITSFDFTSIDNLQL